MFSILRPTLLKLQFFAHLIESFPTAYSLSSCIEIKILIPLAAHPERSPKEKWSKRCSFQSYVLSRWKLHVPAQLIQIFSTEYCLRSCGKEKLLIPLETHHKRSVDRIFCFCVKGLQSWNLLSVSPSCWNCIFKLLTSRAFQRRMAHRSAAKRNRSSHLLVVVPSQAA